MAFELTGAGPLMPDYDYGLVGHLKMKDTCPQRPGKNGN